MGKIQLFLVILFFGMDIKASQIPPELLQSKRLDPLEEWIRTSPCAHEFKEPYLTRYHQKYPRSCLTIDLNYILSMVDVFGESIDQLRPYYLEKIHGRLVRFGGKRALAQKIPMLDESSREKLIDIFLDIIKEKKFKTLVDYLKKFLEEETFCAKDKLKIATRLFGRKILDQGAASDVILKIGLDPDEPREHRFQAAKALDIFGDLYEKVQMDIIFILQWHPSYDDADDQHDHHDAKATFPETGSSFFS